jgi:hypothetical protein
MSQSQVLKFLEENYPKKYNSHDLQILLNITTPSLTRCLAKLSLFKLIKTSSGPRWDGYKTPSSRQVRYFQFRIEAKNERKQEIELVNTVQTLDSEE